MSRVLRITFVTFIPDTMTLWGSKLSHTLVTVPMIPNNTVVVFNKSTILIYTATESRDMDTDIP